MDVSCDWRGFQTLFNPQKKGGAIPSGSLSGGSVAGFDDALRPGPAFIVTDEGRVITAFAEHEDLSEWIGLQPSEIENRVSHRELVIFDRAQVDQWMKESLGQTRFYDQVEYLRREAKPTNRAVARSTRRHFLLSALHSWWGKLLPSAYGVFIRVNGRVNGGSGANSGVGEQDFLLVVRRGVFESFHQPDLGGLSADRRRVAGDVVKYLSGRYFVPVQGIFVSSTEWNEWSQGSDPWKAISRSIRSNRTRLVPKRMGVRTLVGIKSVFGF